MMSSITAITGESILVDVEDIGAVEGYEWRIQRTDPCRYAVVHRRVNGRSKALLMHRLIIGAKKGEIVDHINGDGLDNRRANLRLVTAAQNQQNRRGASKHSKTGVRGVWFEARKNRYVATVRMNRRVVHCSHHHTIEEARAAVIAARARHMTHSAECNEKAASVRG